jgi:hypothetical protein
MMKQRGPERRTDRTGGGPLALDDERAWRHPLNPGDWPENG